MEIKRDQITEATNNGRRFVSFIMDAAICAMTAMLLFAIAGAPMFGYYDTASKLSSTDDSLLANVAKTHLLASTTSIAPSSDSEASAGKVWVANISNEAYNEASDCLRYYTVTYKGGTAKDYADLMLRSDSDYSYSYLFEASSENVVSLKAQYKTLAHQYSSGLNKGTDQESAYNSAFAAFKVTYEKVWVEFGKSEAYLPLYQEHLDLNATMSHSAGWASLVSYAMAAVICYIALPLLNKKGRTIAKRALKFIVVSDKGPLLPWQVISRGFIETLEFSFLTLLAPFFFIQTNAITLTMAGSGLWSFNMFTLCLTALLLTVTSGLLTLFTKQKKSLHDLATFTSVVEEETYEALQFAKEEASDETAESEGEEHV
jgi:uncharacterized RDD family membrane protein YckC